MVLGIIFRNRDPGGSFCFTTELCFPSLRASRLIRLRQEIERAKHSLAEDDSGILPTVRGGYKQLLDELVPGSPAARSGLRVGDFLVEVNGRDTR